MHEEIPHAPVPHVAVAFARVHAIPQLAQLVSVVSAVSQPFAAFASQLPKPASHDAIAQVPVPHVAVALAREQAIPQLAQFAKVVSAVSQPLVVLPSQLPKPALHDPIAHEPVEQVAVALVRLQVVPQLAQFASVVSDASQPLVSTRSQFAKLASHDEIAHEPVEQVGVAFGRAHALPQAPQLVSEVSGASQPFA